MKDGKLPDPIQPDNLIINPSRYSDRPLKALLMIDADHSLCVFLTGFVLYGLFKLPEEFMDSNFINLLCSILYIKMAS